MVDEDLSIRVKITIHGKSEDSHAAAIGLGVVRLCELVQEFGSLNRAAKEMGMAYSKAWRIIHEVEVVLDCPLLTRNGPKGSFLTPEGVRLIKVYRSAEKQIRDASDAILAQCLIDIR